MEDKNNSTRLLHILQLLAAVGAAASVLASVLNIWLGREIPIGAVAIALSVLVAVQALYARARYATNTPPPFPKLLWQVLFNEPGSPGATTVAPLRLAVLHCGDGEEFARDFSTAHAWSETPVLLRDLSSEASSEAYSSSRIRVNISGSARDDEPIMEHLLRNVHGVALVWTDGWLKHEWALRVVARWVRRFPHCPCVVLQKEAGELPQILASWTAREVVGEDPEDFISKRSTSWTLLRQAITRHRQLRKYATQLRNAVIASVILLAGVVASSVYITFAISAESRTEVARVHDALDQASERIETLERPSFYASDKMSEAAFGARRLWDRTIQSLQPEDSTLFTTLDDSMQDIIHDFQDATVKSVAQYLPSFTAEVAVFALAESDSGEVCWCEAYEDAGNEDCFQDDSVISCAMQNSWVVLWAGTAEDSKYRWRGWDLDGREVGPTLVESHCTYVPEPSTQRYLEILCLPTGSRTDLTLRPNQAVDSGLCVSRPAPGDTKEILLDDPAVRKALLMNSPIVASLPWNWYSESASHLTCDGSRR